MSTFESLEQRVTETLGDPELARLSPGLTVTLQLNVDGDTSSFAFVDGRFSGFENGEAVIAITANGAAWDMLLAKPPAPTFHSFTALQIANPAFEVRGDSKLIAQARPLLERIFELVTTSPITPTVRVERTMSQISGHYTPIAVNEREYEVYYETAGEGIPVLFLHTAGADSRQYLEQMADQALAASFKMYALDLPFHGKSMPPRDWDGSSYVLTAALYRDWCTAFIRQVIGERTIIVGGSMGAAICLVLAAERAADILGIVAVEPPFQSRGRRNPYQNHVEVHGGLHNGAYVRGIMSPTSPLADRRRASWIYSQGGPGVYPGDLSFYSDEFDGAVVAPQVDAAATPVALLSGNYDYSATPEDGARLAKLIPAALHIIMDGMGHFPMIEHPDAFRPHLICGLEHIVASIGKP